MSSPNLSVTVITKNEAHRIERCLRSVDFADERIVLDSGSTDDTVAIARRCGARVEISPDWPGFGPQKNRALDLACGEWVLSIDADEAVTPALRESILATIRRDGGPDAYWITRRSTFCGKPIRHGDWRNDRVLRLFRRSRARFTNDPVHERLDCPPPHGELAGLLLHGAGAFLRGYLLRLGFLDGRAGLTLASLSARGTFLRYRLAGRPAPVAQPGERHGAAPTPKDRA